MLKPKLIGPVQGPLSTPGKAASILDWKKGIMQLIKEAGFVAGIFGVKKLLESEQDQVTRVCQSIHEILILLTVYIKIEAKRL